MGSARWKSVILGADALMGNDGKTKAASWLYVMDYSRQEDLSVQEGRGGICEGKGVLRRQCLGMASPVKHQQPKRRSMAGCRRNPQTTTLSQPPTRKTPPTTPTKPKLLSYPAATSSPRKPAAGSVMLCRILYP